MTEKKIMTEKLAHKMLQNYAILFKNIVQEIRNSKKDSKKQHISELEKSQKWDNKVQRSIKNKRNNHFRCEDWTRRNMEANILNIKGKKMVNRRLILENIKKLKKIWVKLLNVEDTWSPTYKQQKSLKKTKGKEQIFKVIIN